MHEVVAKAHKRGNAILRCFMSRDVDMLTRAYFGVRAPSA